MKNIFKKKEGFYHFEKKKYLTTIEDGKSPEEIYTDQYGQNHTEKNGKDYYKDNDGNLHIEDEDGIDQYTSKNDNLVHYITPEGLEYVIDEKKGGVILIGCRYLEKTERNINIIEYQAKYVSEQKFLESVMKNQRLNENGEEYNYYEKNNIIRENYTKTFENGMEIEYYTEKGIDHTVISGIDTWKDKYGIHNSLNLKTQIHTFIDRNGVNHTKFLRTGEHFLQLKDKFFQI